MPVEQRRGTLGAAVMRHNDGMARRWPCRGFEADAAQIRRMPFGIGRAILRKCGIGRDGFDAEHGKKALQRAPHVGVYMRQNPVEIAHVFLPAILTSGRAWGNSQLGLHIRCSCVAHNGLARHVPGLCPPSGGRRRGRAGQHRQALHGLFVP